jgi:hypothetical protein
MEKKKIVKCVIDEGGKLGVGAISLVEFPAIEENFIALNAVKLASVNNERRMLYGPALIPNKYILRIDKNTGEDYYIYFDAATIAKCAHLYLKKNLQHNTTLEHEFSVMGCPVVESWLIEGEKDKAYHFGLTAPVGSWIVGVSITDDEIWGEVKEGTFKGFSIEGHFNELAVQMHSVDLEAEILREISALVAGLFD